MGDCILLAALAERLSSGKWLGDIKRSEHRFANFILFTAIRAQFDDNPSLITLALPVLQCDDAWLEVGIAIAGQRACENGCDNLRWVP